MITKNERLMVEAIRKAHRIRIIADTDEDEIELDFRRGQIIGTRLLADIAISIQSFFSKKINK